MDIGQTYEFVFRGLLAEEALDQAGRSPRHLAGVQDAELARTLSMDLLDPEFVAPARKMAMVYTAIAAFENSARELIRTVLLEHIGEDWWQEAVSEKVRTRAEGRRSEEEETKWHGQRGDDLINYTELNDLANIMQNQWEHFEPHARSVEWVRAVFRVIERSRNVIMHSGVLDPEDIARLGIYIRDWLKQVGA